MAKKWKILIFAGIAVVVGAVLMGSLRSRDRNAPRVTTAKVETVDLVAKVTANGKIQARKKVDMSALVMGQIVNLAVQEGDKVRKGQLLGTLESPEVDQQVAAAKSDALIKKRKNTRLLEAPAPSRDELDFRPLTGGFLVQDAPHFVAGRNEWRVVTKVAPTTEQWLDAELAWRLCGHVKSNCVVLVKDLQAVGIGAGQQSRVGAAEIAAKKAEGRARGGASATDGFYPFADGVEAAADAAVAVVVQPGGSVRDEENIARADELGLAMVLTGERQFLH